MRPNVIFLRRAQWRTVKKAVACFYFLLTVAMFSIFILHCKRSWQISSSNSAGSRQLRSVQFYTEIESISRTRESRQSEAVRTGELGPTTSEEGTNDTLAIRQEILTEHKSTLTTRTRCERNYFLLILVASAPANFDQRRRIRQTWAADSFINLRWKTVFLLGQTRNGNDSEKLQREEAIYGDLIRADYYEDYWNQTLKVEMGFEWAARYCSFSFLLKADDDVFINTPTVIKLLKNPATPRDKLYLGFLYKNPVVYRTGKWAVTVEEYNATRYPDFCAGPGYILSRDVVISFVDIINTIPKFRVDDVYVGMLAKEAGVTGRHDEGFQTPPFSSRKCVLLNNTLVRHNAVGQCLLDLFEKAKPALS